MEIDEKYTSSTRWFISHFLDPSRTDDNYLLDYFVKHFISGEKDNIDFDFVRERILEMKYSDFLKTIYWRGILLHVKKKSEYRCSMCGSDGALQVHHLSYDHHGDEMHHQEDLVCVCRECHAKLHEHQSRRL